MSPNNFSHDLHWMNEQKKIFFYGMPDFFCTLNIGSLGKVGPVSWVEATGIFSDILSLNILTKVSSGNTIIYSKEKILAKNKTLLAGFQISSSLLLLDKDRKTF